MLFSLLPQRIYYLTILNYDLGSLEGQHKTEKNVFILASNTIQYVIQYIFQYNIFL